MGRASTLSERLREQIVQQLENNVPQPKIANNLQISSFTIHSIIERFRETGEISAYKGHGQKPTLDGCDLRGPQAALY